MGEVYRARDPRLDRVVAVKVLPARSSDNAESRQRFEREARAVSSLTHSNICTIYDVGDIDGRPYLVMEYLEGETLADRIARGPLPPSQVARLGAEICEALDAAHRQHIIHRDLKPANVMLTKSGVKLLDFGLAKLRNVNAGTISGNEPTIQQITSEGMILGTLQYMAPEQIEGKEADPRTDIFAAGVVLYEMATGRRPFTGASQASVAAAIVHSDPPPMASQPALERIINPCLAKDRDERWQTARDIALQLRSLGSSTSHEPIIAPQRRRMVAWLLPVIAGLVAGAALSWLAATRFVRPETTPLQLSVVLPDEQALWLENVDSPMALSPDGSRLVYAGIIGETSHLFVRSLASPTVQKLSGTEAGSGPFFKPDGSAVGFFSNGRLKVAKLSGGTVNDLGPAHGPGRGGTWLEDGSIVWSGLPGGGMWRLWPDTGKRQTITTPGPGDGGHLQPTAIPGGRYVLFTSEVDGKAFDQARLEILELATGKRTVVLEGGTHGRLAPGGKMFFMRGDTLYSIPFDIDSLKTNGAPAEVLKPVLLHEGTGSACYDVARNGTIAYIPYSSSIFDHRLVWSDRTGKTDAVPLEPRRYVGPRLSTDGRKLLVEVVGANDHLWISDLARGTLSRLTFDQENLTPVWTADSQSVIFARYATGVPNLTMMRADGGGKPVRFGASTSPIFPSAASADGRWIGALRHAPSTGWDVVVYPSSDGTKPHLEIVTPFNEGAPDFSPDGKWIAYSNDESGRTEVYVQPLERGGERTAISIGGGTEPVWSRDGREIFYRSGNRMMSVPVSTAGGFTAGHPVILFERKFAAFFSTIGRSYDVGPDGRFMFVEALQEEKRIRRIDLLLGAKQ